MAKGVDEEWQRSLQEKIDRSIRVGYTLSTPGWEDIEKIFESQAEFMSTSLMDCPPDQVVGVRESIKSYKKTLVSIRAIIDEGASARLSLENKSESY